MTCPHRLIFLQRDPAAGGAKATARRKRQTHAARAKRKPPFALRKAPPRLPRADSPHALALARGKPLTRSPRRMIQSP